MRRGDSLGPSRMREVLVKDLNVVLVQVKGWLVVDCHEQESLSGIWGSEATERGSESYGGLLTEGQWGLPCRISYGQKTRTMTFDSGLALNAKV